MEQFVRHNVSTSRVSSSIGRTQLHIYSLYPFSSPFYIIRPMPGHQSMSYIETTNMITLVSIISNRHVGYSEHRGRELITWHWWPAPVYWSIPMANHLASLSAQTICTSQLQVSKRRSPSSVTLPPVSHIFPRRFQALSSHLFIVLPRHLHWSSRELRG